MQSYFTNLKTKKEIIDLYYKKLYTLNIDYEFLTIETSFGDTNIIASGNKKNQPLVVIHDANSCAPIALESMLVLKDKFRIIAIDVLGQPNLSAEIRLDSKTDDYGKWMYEILSRLNIYKAFLVGISFGSFISIKALIFDQTRIAKAFLISPTGIISSNFFKTFKSLYLPVKLFKLYRKEKYIHSYYMSRYLQKDDLSFISKLFINYKMNVSHNDMIKKQEAASIHIPIYLVVAKDDQLFSDDKLIKRAKSMFSSLICIKTLDNLEHIFNSKKNSMVSELILHASLD